MGSLAIDNLNDEAIKRLRTRAVEHHYCSVEAEVRKLLYDAVGYKPIFSESVRLYFGPENRMDLELPPRDFGREPPSFD